MALGLAAAVGPGFWIVAFVIGFIARPRSTRHVRAHRDFVALATAAGVSEDSQRQCPPVACAQSAGLVPLT